MTREEYLEIRRKEIDNMTLKQARDVIASSLSHDDMRVEFEKAVKMLLDCADKTLEQESILDKLRAEIETKYGQCSICKYDGWDDNWYEVGDIADILQIIDEYKYKMEDKMIKSSC